MLFAIVTARHLNLEGTILIGCYANYCLEDNGTSENFLVLKFLDVFRVLKGIKLIDGFELYVPKSKDSPAMPSCWFLSGWVGGPISSAGRTAVGDQRWRTVACQATSLDRAPPLLDRILIWIYLSCYNAATNMLNGLCAHAAFGRLVTCVHSIAPFKLSKPLEYGMANCTEVTIAEIRPWTYCLMLPPCSCFTHSTIVQHIHRNSLIPMLSFSFLSHFFLPFAKGKPWMHYLSLSRTTFDDLWWQAHAELCQEAAT